MSTPPTPLALSALSTHCVPPAWELTPAQYDHVAARLGGSTGDLSSSVHKGELSSSVTNAPKAPSSKLQSSVSTAAELSVSPRSLAWSSAVPCDASRDQRGRHEVASQAAAADALVFLQHGSGAVHARPRTLDDPPTAGVPPLMPVPQARSPLQPQVPLPATQQATPRGGARTFRAVLARTLSRNSSSRAKAEVVTRDVGRSSNARTVANETSQSSNTGEGSQGSAARSSVSMRDDGGAAGRSTSMMSRGRAKVAQLFHNKSAKERNNSSTTGGAIGDARGHTSTETGVGVKRRGRWKRGVASPSTAPLALPNAPYLLHSKRKPKASAARPPRPPGRRAPASKATHLAQQPSTSRSSAATHAPTAAYSAANAAAPASAQPPGHPVLACEGSGGQSIDTVYRSLKRQGSCAAPPPAKPPRPDLAPESAPIRIPRGHSARSVQSSAHSGSQVGSPLRPEGSLSRSLIPCSPRRSEAARRAASITAGLQDSQVSLDIRSVRSREVGSPGKAGSPATFEDTAQLKGREEAAREAAKAARAAHVTLAAALTTLPGMPKHLAYRVWEDLEEPKFRWADSRAQVPFPLLAFMLYTYTACASSKALSPS
jgi:hypothetical protein